MSAPKLSRSTTTNESNIPILKRNIVGAKKSKGCSKLPELQKYIESIIKASNEFDSESASLPDREKFSKGRQFRKNVVCKGIENKIKHEKLKFDVISNRRKSKRQTSKEFSEAVSRSVDVLHKFVSEFEDPRNWKIRNSGSHLRIEKLIKKFYPNPYKICCDKEKNTERQKINHEKDKNDEFRNEALNDVCISKVDGETQDNLEKTDNDLVPADSQKSQREDKSADVGLIMSLENSNQTKPLNEINDEESKNSSKLNTMTNTPNKPPKITQSNSLNNDGNRVSSLESITKELCKAQDDLNKLKNLKPSIAINPKETSAEVKKSKTVIADDGNHSDYDLGKLELLNLSDSDDSTTKFYLKRTGIKNKINIASDDFVNEISSEICNEISKTNDLNDLLQIYEVMNKATESFLYLTSINKSGLEDKIISDVLENFPIMEEEDQENLKISKVQNSKSSEIKKDIHKSSSTSVSHRKKNREKVEKKIVEKTSKKIPLKNKQKSAEEKTDDTKVAETKSHPEYKKHENISDNEDLAKFLTLDDPEIKERNVDDEIFDANQKINEVLQFMNDCLSRFGKDEKLPEEKNKNQEEDNATSKSSKNILSEEKENPKTSTASTFEPSPETSLTSSSHPEEVHSRQSTEPDKISKNSRIRHKRKVETVTSNPQEVEIEINVSPEQVLVNRYETASTSHSNIQPAPLPELVENNESIIQVAEGHNELGGYTEESQESNVILSEDLRVSKSILPLSTKVRRSQPETYKILKDALETEEKLLKLSKPEPKKLIACNPETEILTNSTNYSHVSGFENMNSSFVICISQFPQNLRTTTVINPALTIPKPLPLSFIDFTSWNLKPMSQPKIESSSEKLVLPLETEQKALKFMYNFKLGILSILNKAWVTHCATPVCFLAIFNFCKEQREFSLQYSKRQIRVKPLKKFSIVSVNPPGTSGICIRNTVTFTSSKSNIASTSESDHCTNTNDNSVEALIRSIQETENVLLQQQNEFLNNSLSNFESFCSCRSNELLKSEASDGETAEKESDQQRVQNLLLRTYKLQKKLQQHLFTISQTQSASLPRYLNKPTQDFDFTAAERSDLPKVSMSNLTIRKDRLTPLIQRSLHVFETEENKKTDEAVAVNVEMIDRSTTYYPPTEEETQIVDKKSDELNFQAESSPCPVQEEETLNLENDDDDRSSTYSFKSSNDFSETNENFLQVSSSLVTKEDVIKKIFSQIELLKHSVDAEKQDRKFNDKAHDSMLKKEEDLNDDKLADYDSKNPAKVLKTIFKGKKSSTELTIGLKDVPMTNVSNISVEKTKFSPNHTKISICISKENPNEMNIPGNSDTKVLSNNASSYFFDPTKPSLSVCQTEYSKVEDDDSKSSPSSKEGSDEEEDDFKSVASTAANSTTSPNIDKENSKNQAIVKVSPSKNFTKHKFDFYRKMDMNVEGIRVRQKPFSHSLCRYKELEPLKQALTELQIRMRSIKREAILNSDDYYERALKLAKMSAGYCQSCGTRAVIPDDTFGYYKTLLPRRHAHHRRSKHFKTSIRPDSSFYSFRSSNAEVSSQFCDMDIKRSSSFLLNRTTHSNRTVLRSSLKDMPIVFEKI